MTRKDLFATAIVGLITVTAAYAADAPAASTEAHPSSYGAHSKDSKAKAKAQKKKSNEAEAQAQAPAADK